MEINKLEKGMIVKNYKEMCKLLEEDIKAGDSKISQIKEWERYFKYTKKGHSFIVDEVYENILEKKNIKGLNSKYASDIQPLILDLLSQKENNGKITMSCSQLFRNLQMVNINYTMGRNDIPQLSELIKVDEDIIYDFYSYTHTNLKNIVETALNSLQSQSLLNWNKEITVCEESVILEINELGKPKMVNGTICYRTNKIFRPATDDEIQIILRYERDKLLEMNLENKSQVIAKGLWDNFKKSINNKLKEGCNILFYYDSYKIINNQDMILLELQKLGRFEKVDKLDSLNRKISESLTKTIDKKHKNSIKIIDDYSCYEDNKMLSETIYLHAKSNFVTQSEKVKGIVIPRKSRKLSFK